MTNDIKDIKNAMQNYYKILLADFNQEHLTRSQIHVIRIL